MRANKLWNASLGIVLVLAMIWVITQAKVLFPTNYLAWQVRMLILGFATTLVFALSSTKTEKDLWRFSFLKRIHVFVISALITSAILTVFARTISGKSLEAIAEALGGISTGVLLFIGLITAISEELIFRGFLVDKVSKWGYSNLMVAFITSVIFALFHYATAGGKFILLLAYIPLGMLFYTIKVKFSPRTNLANMGVHFAYNLFILGLFI